MILTDEQVNIIKEKLDDIIAMRGPYAMDRLEHAKNVIASNSKLAKDIMEILEDVNR